MKNFGPYPGRKPGMVSSSMVQHNVIFKIKNGCDKAACAWFEENLKPKIATMSGILSWNFGPYCSWEGLNQGFNWGMSYRFADEFARDVYLAHRKHEEAGPGLFDLLEDGIQSIIAFDHAIPNSDMLASSSSSGVSCFTPCGVF